MKAWPLVVLVAWLLGACASPAARELEQARQQRLVSTYLQLGVGYYQTGQLDAAREHLNKVLEVDAQNAQAHGVLALVELRLNNHDQADKHFRRALAVAGDDPELANNYGAFLCERKRFDEAEAWFKKAIDNPKYRHPEQANLNAGLCLMKKPAPAAAEAYLRRALEINPRLPQALYPMARIAYDSGRALSARGFIQRYFEVGRDTPEMLWLAVRVEHALGNMADARHYAQRLREQFPDSAEAKQLQQTGPILR